MFISKFSRVLIFKCLQCIEIPLLSAVGMREDGNFDDGEDFQKTVASILKCETIFSIFGNNFLTNSVSIAEI